MTEVRGDAPHVVMMVANDVANDTRVKKEAIALARAGLRVTLLGASSAALPGDTWLGSIRIVRVPVMYLHQDAARLRRLARRQARPPLSSTARVDRAEARLRSDERDLLGLVRSGCAGAGSRPGRAPRRSAWASPGVVRAACCTGSADSCCESAGRSPGG